MQPEPSKVDVLDAICMLMSGWEEDVTTRTIANSWKHCGLIGPAPVQPPPEVDEAVFELQSVLTRFRYKDTIPAQELIEYNGEQEICQVQTEQEFFANLSAQSSTDEEEEDGDDTIECPCYTSKQVHEALEILQVYAMQKGDVSGEARRAINAYHRYSMKVGQAPHQTHLPDLFARQNVVAQLDD